MIDGYLANIASLQRKVICLASFKQVLHHACFLELHMTRVTLIAIHLYPDIGICTSIRLITCLDGQVIKTCDS